MATLYHQVWIDAPMSRVYEALATAEGVGHWWGPHTSRRTTDGLVLSHGADSPHGRLDMLVVDLVEPRRVEWEIISKHPARSPASAWTGTRIAFELAERENPGGWLGIDSPSPRLTVLELRHSGWDEGSPYLGFCNFGWGAALLELKRWSESHSRGA
jgi:uncharacterized protein YndB with AHSA1/START domain